MPSTSRRALIEQVEADPQLVRYFKQFRDWRKRLEKTPLASLRRHIAAARTPPLLFTVKSTRRGGRVLLRSVPIDQALELYEEQAGYAIIIDDRTGRPASRKTIGEIQHY